MLTNIESEMVFDSALQKCSKSYRAVQACSSEMTNNTHVNTHTLISYKHLEP